MRTLSRSLLFVILAPLLMLVMGASPASAADRNCGDFYSQSSAQAFFLSAGGPSSDPHRLDSDGNGIACESNPCPCSTGTQPPPPLTTVTSAPTQTPTPVPTATSTSTATSTPTSTAPLKVVRVLDGELIKVRQGSAPAYVVHLMGVKVPKSRCEARVSARDLRSWVKPGMAVRADTDRKAGDRDRDGHLWRYLVRLKGNYDIGGSQIAVGVATVDGALKFGLRSKYLKWAAEAKADGLNPFKRC